MRVVDLLNFFNKIYNIAPNTKRGSIENIRLNGPSVVVVGGGTGLSTLLRGLKYYTDNITAVVTVADDGGSSGVLRNEMGIIPPGDIRNCIVALSNAEPTMDKLMQYRFKDGKMAGHSIGNLMLAALADIKGGFEEAVNDISTVLNITGRVLPVSLDDVHIKAVLEDGTEVLGESSIGDVVINNNTRIKKITLNKDEITAHPEIAGIIKNADLIILGPGSLYTSIIPNLLFKEVADALRHSHGVKLYIANTMTQPGETGGMTASEHIKAIIDHGGNGIIKCLLINDRKPDDYILSRYAKEGSEPVECDYKKVMEMGIEVVKRDLIKIDDRYFRHHPEVLARNIIDMLFLKRRCVHLKFYQNNLPKLKKYIKTVWQDS